jgi:hypothetical protein
MTAPIEPLIMVMDVGWKLGGAAAPDVVADSPDPVAAGELAVGAEGETLGDGLDDAGGEELCWPAAGAAGFPPPPDSSPVAAAGIRTAPAMTTTAPAEATSAWLSLRRRARR